MEPTRQNGGRLRPGAAWAITATGLTIASALGIGAALASVDRRERRADAGVVEEAPVASPVTLPATQLRDDGARARGGVREEARDAPRRHHEEEDDDEDDDDEDHERGFVRAADAVPSPDAISTSAREAPQAPAPRRAPRLRTRSS